MCPTGTQQQSLPEVQYSTYLLSFFFGGYEISYLQKHWVKNYPPVKGSLTSRLYYAGLSFLFYDCSPQKRPGDVMAGHYVVSFSFCGGRQRSGQMVGLFDSPDGCSVWRSVTLGRLIDMLPALPSTIQSPHPPHTHTHTLTDSSPPFLYLLL